MAVGREALPLRKEPVRKPGPFVLEWRFTSRCNLGCIHCNRDESAPVLSTARAGWVLDTVQAFCLRLERPGIVRFSGGEPLLSSTLPRLVEGAVQRGLAPELRTNATLVSAKAARRLRAAGLRTAHVRIHGLGPSHDVLTRPGSFDLALEGTAILRQAGIRVFLTLALTRINQDEAVDAVRLAEAVADGIVIERFVSHGRSSFLAGEELSPAETKGALHRLARLGKRLSVPLAVNDPLGAVLLGTSRGIHMRPCPAGRDLLAVDPCGNVFPCHKLPLSAGNVFRLPLHEIYAAPLLRALRSTCGTIEWCGSCTHGAVCRGCRADAFTCTGDPLGPDPRCFRRGTAAKGKPGRRHPAASITR